MSEIQTSLPSFQSATEWLKTLIDGINRLDNFTGTVQDLPKELLEIVQYLETQGYNFSEMSWARPLIHDLIDAYNLDYKVGERRKFQLSYPIDATKSVVSETLSSPKAVAWKQWLETTGKALGRNEEDIEINGDIVTVKIPGDKNLVFNPAEYIFWDQGWKSNDKEGQEEWFGNKFSKVDFEKLVEFLGGRKVGKIWRAGKDAVPFFRDVLGLETGRLYWSSDRNDDGVAWGLDLGENGVDVDYYVRDDGYSAIVSQNS